jgi:hypothetical protein
MRGRCPRRAAARSRDHPDAGHAQQCGGGGSVGGWQSCDPSRRPGADHCRGVCPSNAIPDPLGFCRAYAGTGFAASPGDVPAARRSEPRRVGRRLRGERLGALLHSDLTTAGGERIFFVRADGSQPLRRSVPSRDPSSCPVLVRQALPAPTASLPLSNVFTLSPDSLQPNGRRIAFTTSDRRGNGQIAVPIRKSANGRWRRVSCPHGAHRHGMPPYLHLLSEV